MAQSKLKLACTVLILAVGGGLVGVNVLQSQTTRVAQVPEPPPAVAAPITYVPVAIPLVFDGKALRITMKTKDGVMRTPEILLDPEVKYLGTRTFVVGKRPNSAGKIWIPVEDLASIGEFKDIGELNKDKSRGEPVSP
jgi:hypothetical protein